MWSAITRLFGELFLFVGYLRLAARLSKLGTAHEATLDSEKLHRAIQDYAALTDSTLEELSKCEISRGQAPDDKTFKFGTTFATVLTFATGVLAALGQSLTSGCWRTVVMALAIPAIFYSAAGGLLGLAAARTMRTFGTGPAMAATMANAGPVQRPIHLARAVAYQERINLQRVARNEAAFMCIRNGAMFIVFALAAIVIAGTLVTPKSETPGAKLWLAAYLWR